MSELRKIESTEPCTAERRALLAGAPNPRERQDYIVTLEGALPLTIVPGSTANIRLSYVPDRLIIMPISFELYLEALPRISFGSMEEAASSILDDINNEIVPRWIRVIASVKRDDLFPVGQRVLLEDRQPRWDNPSLLARLSDT